MGRKAGLPRPGCQPRRPVCQRLPDHRLVQRRRIPERHPGKSAGRGFSGDPSTWVGEAACTNSGSVKQITIGGQPVDGDDVRSAFGLRSSNFTLACADSIFTFTVRGYGHGVGMSQTGAQFMAQQGSDYQEILAWYYPNTTLVSV